MNEPNKIETSKKPSYLVISGKNTNALERQNVVRMYFLNSNSGMVFSENKSLIKKFQSKNISFCSDSIEAIKETDCVMTDVWVSMGEKKSVKKKKIFTYFICLYNISNLLY